MTQNEVIDRVKKTEHKLSFVIAGGGASILDLFKVAGCSAVMTEAQFIYDFTSYERFFDVVPNCGYVSNEMANYLALELHGKRPDTIAVAVTSAVKTNRERRGSDRSHISIVRDGKIIHACKVDLVGSDRYMQDQEVANNVFEIVVKVLENV